MLELSFYFNFAYLKFVFVDLNYAFLKPFVDLNIYIS